MQRFVVKWGSVSYAFCFSILDQATPQERESIRSMLDQVDPRVKSQRSACTGSQVALSSESSVDRLPSTVSESSSESLGGGLGENIILDVVIIEMESIVGMFVGTNRGHVRFQSGPSHCDCSTMRQCTSGARSDTALTCMVNCCWCENTSWRLL